MKKALGALLVTFFISISLFAQLKIKSGDKGFYLEHKVAKGENFYSIGRLYHVDPKTLAAYNSLNMYKGLNAGSLIHVPLTDSNYSTNSNKGKPVYYVVQNEQTLAEVGHANKVATNNLRSWNHFREDNVLKGQKIIVGYLIAAPAKNSAIATKENKQPVQKVQSSDVTTTDVTATKTENKTEEPGKAEQYKITVDTAKSNMEIVKPKVTADITQDVVEKHDSKQGFFKWDFEQQLKGKTPKKNQTVTSGIFKSTSGWTDAKYYLLIDEIEPGTVVKITNPSNNKTIYAKVLSEMKGVAQSPGIDIRISNAAASILEIDETDKFILKLNY